MNTLNERIIRIAEHYGVNKPSKFSKATGFSHQVASNYLKSVQKPSVDALQKIQLCFDQIDSAWLLTGKGNMLLEDSSQETKEKQLSNTEINLLNGEGVVIPVYNMDAYAGNSISFFGNTQYIEKYYKIPFAKEGDISINVVGNSMYPHIHSGDAVVIREINNWKEWIIYGKCYVIITEEQFLIKIIRKSKDDPKTHYNIYSANVKEYDDFDMPQSDVKQLFLVIGIVGKRSF